MKRAWLLARVSTTKKSQDQSPERQLADGRAWIAAHEATEVGFGVERESGASLDRPELNLALDAVRRGKVDVLVLADLDRLGRNVKEMLACADDLRARGVRLVFLTLADESMVDTGTAMGRLLFTVLAAVGEFFRNHYRDKAMAGQAFARSRGRHVGRRRQMSDAAERRIVELAGDRQPRPPHFPAAEHSGRRLSLGSIARRLANEGLGAWSRGAIDGALKRANGS